MHPSPRPALWFSALTFAAMSCVDIDNPMVCAAGSTCDGGTGAGTAGGGATGGGTTGGGATGGGATGGGATGGGATGGGATGGGATGGGATGGGATGGGATGGGSGCAESWVCGYWQPTSTAGMATRTCFDQNACGTTASKPSEGPMTLPALDSNFYRCNVQPILAKSCAMVGCHGTRDAAARPFRVFARARERNNETVVVPARCLDTGMVTVYLPDVSATGSCYSLVALTATERQLNFDNARGLAMGGVPTAMNELLTQPLKGSANTHAGIKPWTATNPDYVVVQNWLNGTTLATCNSGAN